jgi:acetyl esterase
MSTLSNGIEPTTRKFLEGANAGTGPQIYELTPEKAREVINGLQNTDVKKMSADIEDRKVTLGTKGEVAIKIVRPKDVKGALPALIYVHGAGWVLGGWETHDRLVLELANKAQVAVVFIDYSRSPEAKYPVAIEECYEVTKYVADNAKSLNIDSSMLAIAGDSVGGNMATVVTMLAKERSGPRIDFQLLFYPVTDANFETESYKQFGTKHFLSLEAMKWFWNQYTTEKTDRKMPTVSPLQASLDQLKKLPPAMIFTAEFDVLRDEGEAYAHKLSEAGVRVTATRCLGTIHDFVMLNVITETPAARFAIDAAAAALKQHLHQEVAAVR